MYSCVPDGPLENSFIDNDWECNEPRKKVNTTKAKKRFLKKSRKYGFTVNELNSLFFKAKQTNILITNIEDD